ncbi:MAG: hypothetical protein ACI9SE_001953 [Neolewinella sp.]|jgi:hypothetical protein
MPGSIEFGEIVHRLTKLGQGHVGGVRQQHQVLAVVRGHVVASEDNGLFYSLFLLDDNLGPAALEDRRGIETGSRFA